MKTYFCLLALITACFASPINETIDKRKSGPGQPAVIQFFYDDKCQIPSSGTDNTVSIHSNDNPLWHGGPYGTRSAFFASTGDFKFWYITEYFNGDGGGLKFIEKPDIVKCVFYPTGINAVASMVQIKYFGGR